MATYTDCDVQLAKAQDSVYKKKSELTSLMARVATIGIELTAIPITYADIIAEIGLADHDADQDYLTLRSRLAKTAGDFTSLNQAVSLLATYKTNNITEF